MSCQINFNSKKFIVSRLNKENDSQRDDVREAIKKFLYVSL